MFFFLIDFSKMERKGLATTSLPRPCQINQLLICCLGLFGIVGQLVHGRHHDILGQKFSQSVPQALPLTASSSQQSGAPVDIESTLSKDSGK